MVAMFQGPVASDPIEEYGTDATPEPPTLRERVTAEMATANHVDTRKVAVAALVEAAEVEAGEPDPFGDEETI